MAEWLLEEGIGEHRAVLMDGERIVEARVAWPGRLAAGWIVDGKLVTRAAGSKRGTALSNSGEQVLVDRLPRQASEGATLRLAIVRAAMDGPGRLKTAQGRPTEAPLAQPSLGQSMPRARIMRRFPGSDWDNLIDEALSGEIAFARGSLICAPTAAITTVDIDGDLPPRALALAAVPVVANTIRRLDLAGSLVIDFPTLSDKADRRAVDEALGQALADWPHERTAMNGFGLVQIVSRCERASLLQLASWQRAKLVWRRLLRRAEALEGAGTIELLVHPVLATVAEPDHLAELERRTGRRVRLRQFPGLALEAPHAQLLADG